MLILLPPSEGKTPPPRRGAPLDLAGLSFPELTCAREAVLDALIETSRADDAPARLGVGASLATEVARNTRLRELPTRPASAVYSGVLYAALDWPTLSAGAKRRAGTRLVIVSALWGALRPGDRIPPYRLSMAADLPGIGPRTTWRRHLEPVLDDAAGTRGVIVDCRSELYAKAWTPRGAAAERTATIRVWNDGPDGRSIVSHMAKHTRGQVARHLLEAGAEPRSVPDLADVLARRWQVDAVRPTRSGRPWMLDLRVSSIVSR